MGNVQLYTDTYANGNLITHYVYNDAYENSVVYGENYPDWRKRIAEMRDATTTLSGNKVKFKNTSGNCSIRYKTKSYFNWTYQEIDRHLHAVAFSFPITPSFDVDPLKSRALTRWYKKAAAAQRKFSTPVFLGELLETVRMLKKPLAGLRNGIDDYRNAVMKRRSRKMSFSQFRRMASETWLEYSFGWVPLLADLEDLRTATNEAYGKARLGHEYIYARDSDTFENSVTPQSFSYGYAQAKWNLRKTGDAICVVRGVVGLDEEVWPKTLQIYGLTLRDFIDAAWELTPWSFLIDYFVDVQGILNAYSFPKGTVKWMNRTTIQKRKHLYTDMVQQIPSTLPAYFETLGFTPCEGKSERRVVNREKFSSPPLPGLVFDVPGLRQSLNIAALAGAGSLRNMYSVRGI